MKFLELLAHLDIKLLNHVHGDSHCHQNLNCLILTLKHVLRALKLFFFSEAFRAIHAWMPRHSSRFTYLAPEQQITQYLVDNPLINAILDDEEDKIIQIVKEGDCDLNKPDADRQTALHYAAFIGNPVILY